MNYTKAEIMLIWLDSFIGLEYKIKKDVYEVISDAQDVKSELANCKEYIIANSDERTYETIAGSYNRIYIDFLTDGLNRRGIRAITLESSDYPEKLFNTEIPPLVLYAKGDTELLKDKTIGMVGSRKSLPVSLNTAKNFAKELSGAGFTLITGIAEGVDSSVVEGVLDSDGKIISVIAGGFDKIYPASNASLVDRISESGLVLAEYPPEVKPERFMFPVRNRIIAGLSDGVLIVSGGKKSGTLYTAEYAEEYGRDLFAVPYGVGVESGAGCNELIKRGAMLCDSPDDILNFYSVEKKKKTITLTAEEKNVIEILKNGAKHIEEISRILKRETYEIQTVLSVLEIKGVVAKNGVNVYGLIFTESEV